MRAKKSLGQHFLKSKAVVHDMVAAAEITKNDVVVEIGPGKGVLTEALLRSAKQVIAIEKDSDLVHFLQKKFEANIVSKKLVLIHADVLAMTDSTADGLPTTDYKIVANIPYYITGAILKYFFSQKKQPSCMVLLIQKEVAERIVAREGKESVLSLSVKVYGRPNIIRTVPARMFSPAPKVDSAVLAITNISRELFADVQVNEQMFFNIIKCGFSHKRKFLINNLALTYDKPLVEQVFSKLKIHPHTRAEDISWETWYSLAQNMYQSLKTWEQC